jgi:nitrate/nitrite-specific signal transduction histidine kinase
MTRLKPGSLTVLVVGGITLLLGQVVPLWLGRSLLDDADALDRAGSVRTSSTPA